MTETALLKRSITHTGLRAFSIVQTENQQQFAGVRVESEVYPLTIESAQAAIGIALSEGQKPIKLWTVAIDGDGKEQLEYSAEVYAKAYGVEIDKLSSNFAVNLTPICVADSFKSLYQSKAKSTRYKQLAHQSNYFVRAWVETEKGWIFGHNFEHSFLGLGLCAERVAVAKAISYNMGRILSVHIDTAHHDLAQPCGACRQVLSEKCGLNTPISLIKNEKIVQTNLLSDYLPYPFDPNFDKKMHF